MPPRPLVLIVDDSALVTQALGLLFEETGRRVAVAGSVGDAVRACRAERPALMLLDLTLADGDGLEVLQRLGGTDALPAVTVALTGHDDDATVARCRAAGCRAVLLKPVPTRELLAMVEGWLDDGGASGDGREA